MIEAERIYLRPVALADAAFILELQNTPKWLKYIGDRNIRSIEDAQKTIQEKMIDHYDKHGYGNFVIVNKEGQQSLGTCGLFNRPGLEGVDIGFALLPNFEGKGFGAEAAFALLAHAKDQLKLKKVGAIALPENAASVHLIKKLGLEFVKQVKLPGDPVSLDYYEIQLNK